MFIFDLLPFGGWGNHNCVRLWSRPRLQCACGGRSMELTLFTLCDSPEKNYDLHNCFLLGGGEDAVFVKGSVAKVQSTLQLWFQ